MLDKVLHSVFMYFHRKLEAERQGLTVKQLKRQRCAGHPDNATDESDVPDYLTDDNDPQEINPEYSC